MKTPNVHIVVYWGARRETVDDCSHPVASYYQGLGRVSSYLRDWRPTGKSKPIVDIGNEATVRELLSTGQNRRDIGGDPIPELGYSITLWNGERALTAQSRIQCGLFSKAGEMKNLCSLVLSHSLARQLGESALLDGLKYMIDVWNPDKGSAYVYVDRDEPNDGEIETAVLLEFVRSPARAMAGADIQEVARTANGRIYRSELVVRQVLG